MISYAIAMTPIPVNQINQKGPFDIIGDVHGCYDELMLLLEKLGYRLQQNEQAFSKITLVPPPGRRLVFVGDLVDRGPAVPEVLKLVMQLVQEGLAFCVPGNHDDKLMRKLSRRNVQVNNGLEETLAQLATETAAFQVQVREFLAGLPLHVVLDEGKLVVAHAGLKESLHYKTGKEVRALCLFGPTTGRLDEHGLPERLNWAEKYSGKALVVYGHTPVAHPRWENNTVNIDTGCVYGGQLTALRYPELETVSVKALKQYAVPKRNFLGNSSNLTQ